jgi:hypothetical protein
MAIRASYLGPVEEEAAAAVTGLFPENDNRLDPSLRFNTVFILVKYLLIPVFFSLGAAGPSFAGALMMAVSGSNQMLVDVLRWQRSDLS